MACTRYCVPGDCLTVFFDTRHVWRETPIAYEYHVAMGRFRFVKTQRWPGKFYFSPSKALGNKSMNGTTISLGGQ